MVRVLVVSLVVLAAACGGSSPLQPSPAPQPPPDPQFEAVRESLTFGTLGATGWPFTAAGRNVGAGCAVRVRGATRFFQDGVEVLTVPWALDPTRVIRPQEPFDYASCCVSTALADANLGWNIRFEWDTVRC